MNVSFDSVPDEDEESENLPPASGLNSNNAALLFMSLFAEIWKRN
jgi:hypothetical protein